MLETGAGGRETMTEKHQGEATPKDKDQQTLAGLNSRYIRQLRIAASDRRRPTGGRLAAKFPEGM